MSRAPLFSILALAGCVAVPVEPQPLPVAPVPSAPASCTSGYCKTLERFRAEVQQRTTPRVPDVDVTMKTHMDCRYLFLPGSDGMTNCLMRGMDRHVPRPVDERYLQPGDVTLTVPRGVIPRHDPGVPAYPVAPGAAYVPPSALQDCRLDRSGAACWYPIEPQSPWGNPWQPGYQR